MFFANMNYIKAAKLDTFTTKASCQNEHLIAPISHVQHKYTDLGGNGILI